MAKLIIPAAKFVPEELQNIGRLPAVIYPVNQRIMFDYIYEQYAGYCDAIRVVCCEGADKVHRRLAGYGDSEVEIVVLPQMGDLGYTLYCGLDGCEGEIIINFADTIVFDGTSINGTDMFFYAEEEACNIWTFFDMKDGVISDIYDKTEIFPAGKKKLFVGVFRIQDAGYFRNCLEEAFSAETSEVSTFYQALMRYSHAHPVQAVETKEWMDIGHAGKYFDTQLEVKAREFNHITIDKDRGILKKTSDNKEKLIGEILWYLKLPADVEYVRPRIFSYSLSYEAPYVSMEYYAYHTVHELFLDGDLSKKQWMDVFHRIRFVCSDFRRHTLEKCNFRDSLEDMYLTKTLQRMEQLRGNSRFTEFWTRPVVINGIKYQCLDEIMDRLKVLIPESLYDVRQFCIIHGDLCFANIMIDNNFSFIKVIDPRGKFGEYDLYGDFRYEIAKLFHSLDGKYDYIIKGLIEVRFQEDTAEIDFYVRERAREYDLFEIFKDVFRAEIGDDIDKIELIEAILFLSMIPLHNESIEHQMAMLGTGIEILDRVADIRVGDKERL